jgi:amidase
VPEELHSLSAVQLRDVLRGGQASAVEAAEHFLDRIGQRNPLLGAFITVTAEQAIEQARAADGARAGGPRSTHADPFRPIAFRGDFG